MVVVLSLLFLPAAAAEFGRYWSMDAASDTAEGILRAFGTHWQPNGYITLTVQHNRQSRYVVRLASRSGLFGCSVDGAGLLFLPVVPAAEPVCYWSVSSRADAREYICEAVRIQGEYSAWAYGIWRYARCMLRLASRSELSGCLSGVLLSVPAR